MIIDELKTYKGRELQIKTLEHKLIIFAYDIERKKLIEQQLKELKFEQSKLDDACAILTEKEYEIIFNIYMNSNYRFESLIRVSLDFHFTYSAVRAYKKSALEKLEEWNKVIS